MGRTGEMVSGGHGEISGMNFRVNLDQAALLDIEAQAQALKARKKLLKDERNRVNRAERNMPLSAFQSWVAEYITRPGLPEEAIQFALNKI